MEVSLGGSFRQLNDPQPPAFLRRTSAIVDVVAKVLLPLVLGYAAWRANEQLGLLNARVAAESRDTNVMRDFADLYAKNRKLAARFAAGVHDVDARESLQHYMLWDALERNMAEDPERLANREHPDWHLMGDVAFALSQVNSSTPEARAAQDRFAHWWDCDLRLHTLGERWPAYASDLEALFRWIEQTYRLPLPKGAARTQLDCSKPQ